MTDATPSDQHTPSEQRAATSSIGELMGEVTRDLSTLMRQEVALAKAELKDVVSKGAKGGGLLGGAGYSALMAVLFLSIALWWALGTLVGNGWSGLIVAAIWAIIAAVLFFVGRSQLEQIQGTPQTVETVKEIPETLRRNEENR